MRKVFFAVVVGISFWGFALPPYPPPDIVAKVIRVIDGNTIEVKLLQVPDQYAPDLQPEKVVVVCYIGVDAPEPDHPDSLKATELNSLLVENREIYLELEAFDWFDSQGRLLAYVYLDPYGYLMVNKILIASPIIGVKIPENLPCRYRADLELADVYFDIDIIELSNPVAPGGLAWIKIKTAPGAICTATLWYSLSLSDDVVWPTRMNLPERKADRYGIVEWIFYVPPFILGSIDVRIVATLGDITTSLRTYIRVRR